MFLYKYKPINIRTLEILINKELYFPITQQFNDPFDGQLEPSVFINELKELGFTGSEQKISMHDESITARIKGYGVLSLSRVCDDILMWSHYADSHKGCCFGFNHNLVGHIENEWPIDQKSIRYSHEHPFREIFNDLILKKRFNSEDGFVNFCDVFSELEEETGAMFFMLSLCLKYR